MQGLTYHQVAKLLVDRLVAGRTDGTFRKTGFYLGDLEDLLEDLSTDVPVCPSAWLALDRSDEKPLTLTCSQADLRFVVILMAESARSRYEGAVGLNEGDDPDPAVVTRHGALSLLQKARDLLHGWRPDGEAADWFEPVEWNGIQQLFSSRQKNLVVYLGRFRAQVQIDACEPDAAAPVQSTLTVGDGGTGETIYESTEDLTED